VRVLGKTLELKVSEFITVINENPDKTEENERISSILIGFVRKNRNQLTEKQRKWVVEKLNFIFRKNKKLGKMNYCVPNFSDVFFINEGEVKNIEDYKLGKDVGFGKYLRNEKETTL
jgi:hypothetical protein